MRVLLVVLFVFLTGCKAMGIRGGLSTEDRARINNVAVISLMGNTFSLNRVGTTIFESKLKTADVKDWAIDAFIEARLTENLQGKFKKVKILKDRPTEMTSESLKSMTDSARALGFDAVVVAMPSSYGNAPAMRPGYGLQRTSSIYSAHSNVYILGLVRVYSAVDGKVLAWQWTFDSMSGKPNVLADEELPWKDEFSQFNPQEKSNLEKALKAHIAGAMEYSVKALNF